MSESTAQQMDRHSYISLETFRRDGSAVPTPVWHAEMDDKLYVFHRR